MLAFSFFYLFMKTKRFFDPLLAVHCQAEKNAILTPAFHVYLILKRINTQDSPFKIIPRDLCA